MRAFLGLYVRACMFVCVCACVGVFVCVGSVSITNCFGGLFLLCIFQIYFLLVAMLGHLLLWFTLTNLT